MSEYVLTADEVLYLAASKGADSFYGVRDNLTGLSEQDLRVKVLEMEDSLNRKGYMQSDFDGNSFVDEELGKMIGGCGDCDGMVCFEWEILGEPQEGCLYFIKDKHIYEMMPRQEKYVFREISWEALTEAVQKGIRWKEVNEGEENRFSIKQKELEKAAKLAGRGAEDKAKELMAEAGAGEETADTIVAGMQNKADFYSVFFVNNRMEEDPALSVQFLQGKKLIAMAYEEQNDEDYVSFYTSSQDKQKALLAKGFEKISALMEKGTDADISSVVKEAEIKMEFE